MLCFSFEFFNRQSPHFTKDSGCAEVEISLKSFRGSRVFVWGHQPANQPGDRRSHQHVFSPNFTGWRWRRRGGGGGGHFGGCPHHSFNESQHPALQTLSSTLDTGNCTAAANYFLAFDPRVWWHMFCVVVNWKIFVGFALESKQSQIRILCQQYLPLTQCQFSLHPPICFN